MNLISVVRQNMRPLLMIVSMMIGILAYRPISALNDMTGQVAAPSLIFLMLFVTFCRVRVHELRFTWLHLLLISFQIVAAPLCYYLFLPFGSIVAQGAMICFLAPIAMGAVAIGAALGGNVMVLAGYTLICNLVIAFVAPYYLDIFGNGECTLAQILARVAPLLLAPLAAAQILKRVCPVVTDFVARYSQVSFYLWLGSMLVTLGRTTDYIVAVSDTINLAIGLGLAAVALVACGVQYAIGHYIGVHFGESVAGTQSLGQKNTVLAVWLAHSFLDPVSSIAPTAYIIWQNLTNSFQIYRYDKATKRAPKPRENQ